MTRPHGTGRVLDAESCREGVESLENDEIPSGSDWEAIPCAEEGEKSLELLPGDSGRVLDA